MPFSQVFSPFQKVCIENQVISSLIITLLLMLVHSWQNGVNRADKSDRKGLALERQFDFKDGGQVIVPV